MNYNIRQLLPIEPTQSENESIRFVLIGSRDWIIETIHTLHHLGFAEAGLWSPIVPVPNSTEAMALLKRTRSQ
ncbi:hypothetical protein [Phormidesmis priestleyi]|uniref:hypothetical protein n=1 Tax=Phormidesmis priestleyi TaxID=268141 RepID=UPI00083A705C|nr:hypothetical protein [Phormidesmis priestleyi]